MLYVGYGARLPLAKFFFIKNKYIMKNLTDFSKTVEIGVDPRRLN